nr:hypothetical protein [Streptomyces pathocidini]
MCTSQRGSWCHGGRKLLDKVGDRAVVRGLGRRPYALGAVAVAVVEGRRAAGEEDRKGVATANIHFHRELAPWRVNFALAPLVMAGAPNGWGRRPIRAVSVVVSPRT